MLPSELSRYKIVGNTIIPLFASEDDIPIASEIIGLFKIGDKLGDVQDREKILEQIYQYNSNLLKFIRGLYRIMVRKCTLTGESPIEPILIRRELFSRGPIINEEDRQKTLKAVSNSLKIDAERFMYADLDSEKIISSIEDVSPEKLLKEYNLSLLQTLLFKCYKIRIQVEDNWKEIARRIKWLGLMYLAYENPTSIEIMGPATLLKLTEKYGRNIAILLPYILSSKNWKIEAEVVIGKNKKRIYKLELSNFRFIENNTKKYEKEFDSSIEEKFYNDFKNSIKDWAIIREPEALVANKHLFIPDFKVTKGNLSVYIEIVGFWTKNYIREKISKLRNIKVPILVILNSELSKEDFQDFQVIKFKGKVNIAEVYKWLKDYERKNANYEIDYSLDRDVVSIKEICKKINAPEDVLRKNLKKFSDYTFIKNYYIKNDILDKLRQIDFTNKKLNDLINQYGDYIVEVLDFLGYKLKWINITDAIVTK